MTKNKVNGQALEVLVECRAVDRFKLQDGRPRTAPRELLGMSLQVLDDDGSCVLVFVLKAREMRDAEIPQVPKEDNVKVAASLLQVAEEPFDDVHSMKQLKPLYMLLDGCLHVGGQRGKGEGC